MALYAAVECEIDLDLGHVRSTVVEFKQGHKAFRTRSTAGVSNSVGAGRSWHAPLGEFRYRRATCPSCASRTVAASCETIIASLARCLRSRPLADRRATGPGRRLAGRH